MTAHKIGDPTVSVTTVAGSEMDWLAVSAKVTREVPAVADRDDLVVTVAPGAGHGAPACFLPTHAAIEVDSACFGSVDPTTITPGVVADRARYAPGWGAIVHECAHARHSVWEPPLLAHPGYVEAANLLEESRMESAHVARRSDDRIWLRACVNDIVCADTHLDDPAQAPQMTRHDAAQAAALLLARTDAGLLEPKETAGVATEVEKVLGAELLGKLRELWREALTVADDDTAAMIDLGRRWHELLPPDQPDAATNDEAPAAPSSPPPLSPLADAVAAALEAIAAAVDAELNPDPGFTSCTRPPTAEERTAARILARALTTAGTRDRVVTKTTSAVPPGRLRMRGVLAGTAQRAAGAVPTAEPFVRTTRAIVPAPPLRIGIACDGSGSMSEQALPVASAAWILANAARHATVSIESATVLFGETVCPITTPGTIPTVVTEWEADHWFEEVPGAIDYLDAVLHLSHRNAARLLVFISDGQYWGHKRDHAQRKLDRLRAAGCGVLWLTSSRYDEPLDGATVHQLSTPATAARAIGRAATAALRATS